MRTRRKLSGVLAVVTAGVLAATGCAATQSQDNGSSDSGSLEGIKLKINGAGASSNDPSFLATKAFAETVRELSDAQIEVEVFEPFTVLGSDEVLGGVESGLADVGALVPAYHPQELPLTAWVFEVWGNATYEGGMPPVSLAASASINEFSLTNQDLLDEYEAQGVKLLASPALPPANSLVCRDAVETASDMDGRTVRVAGPVWEGQISAWGATSVNVPFEEIYEGMERGIFDCTSMTLALSVESGIVEVAKHVYPVTFSHGIYPLIISLRVWNDLPPEAQNIVQEAAYSYWEAMTDGNIRAMSDYVAKAVDAGVVLDDGVTAELDEQLNSYKRGVLEDAAASSSDVVADPGATVGQVQDLVHKWSDEAVAATGDHSSTPLLKQYQALADSDFEAFFEAHYQSVFEPLIDD